MGDSVIRATAPVRPFRWSCFLIAVAGVFTLAGCGRSVGSITGKVVFQGKPLKGGNISFVSTEGEPSAASAIAEDGSYSIPRITSGEYKVVVETATLKPLPPGSFEVPGQPKTKVEKLDTNPDVPAGYRPSNPADASAAAAQTFKVKHYVEIPIHFSRSESTTLTYTVVGGSQTHDVELK